MKKELWRISGTMQSPIPRSDVLLPGVCLVQLACLSSPAPNPPLQRDASPASRLRAPELAR